MATPTPVQRVGWLSNQSAESGAAFILPLPNPTGASNCLLLWFQVSTTGSGTIAVTDAAGNTWPSSPSYSVTDSGNAMKLCLYILPGAAAITASGMTPPWIKVSFGSGGTTKVYGFQPQFAEFYNVATSSPVDGTPTHTLQAPAKNGTVQAGSVTTTVNGDLVLQFCTITDNGENGLSGAFDGLSVITPDSSGNFTLLLADIANGTACQYYVQPTAGAINPGFSGTWTASATSWPTITVALKAASAGTAPSATAARMAGVQWFYLKQGTSPTPYKVQFPTFGSAFAANCSIQNNAVDWTATSGSVSGSWTMCSLPSGSAQAGYKVGTAGSNEILTITSTIPAGDSLIGVVVDWMNVSAFDNVFYNNSGSGSAGTTPPTVVTPGVSNGVWFSVMALLTGPPNAMVSPSGGIYMCPNYTGQTDASVMTDGDCWGWGSFSSTSTFDVEYNDTQASGGYNGVVMTFAQSSSGNPISALGVSASTAEAPLAIVGPLTAIAVSSSIGEAPLGGAGALTSLGTSASSGVAQPTGAASIAALAASDTAASVQPTGISPVQALGVSATAAAAQPGGSGAVTGLGVSASDGHASLAGSGALDTLGASESTGIAQPSGSGAVMTVAVSATSGEASVTGAAAVTANAVAASEAAVALTGPGAMAALAVSESTGTAQPQGSGAVTALATSPTSAIVALSGANPGAFGFIAVSATANSEQPAAPVTDYITPVGESATAATIQAGSPGPFAMLASASSAALAQLAASGLLAAIAAGFTRASVSLTGSGALAASGASGSVGQTQPVGGAPITAQGASVSAATVNGIGLGAGATSARGISISSGQGPITGAGVLSLLATADSAATTMLGGAMPLSLRGVSMSVGPGQLSASFALSMIGASSSDGRAILPGTGVLDGRGASITIGSTQIQGSAQIGSLAVSLSTATTNPLGIPPGVLTAIGLSVTSGFVMPHGQTPLVSNPSFVVKLPNGGLTVWLK
jgi:trimeric autotransporter adhesin